VIPDLYGILSFNKIIAEEAMNRGLRVVDVFPLRKKMHDDTSLVGADCVHPSVKEYAEWEKLIFPTAFELLIK
jgi:hypothetical protein